MSGWNCAACTFLNPPRKRRCGVCNHRRPVVVNTVDATTAAPTRRRFVQGTITVVATSGKEVLTQPPLIARIGENNSPNISPSRKRPRSNTDDGGIRPPHGSETFALLDPGIDEPQVLDHNDSVSRISDGHPPAAITTTSDNPDDTGTIIRGDAKVVDDDSSQPKQQHQPPPPVDDTKAEVERTKDTKTNESDEDDSFPVAMRREPLGTTTHKNPSSMGKPLASTAMEQQDELLLDATNNCASLSATSTRETPPNDPMDAANGMENPERETKDDSSATPTKQSTTTTVPPQNESSALYPQDKVDATNYCATKDLRSATPVRETSSSSEDSMDTANSDSSGVANPEHETKDESSTGPTKQSTTTTAPQKELPAIDPSNTSPTNDPPFSQSSFLSCSSSYHPDETIATKQSTTTTAPPPPQNESDALDPLGAKDSVDATNYCVSKNQRSATPTTTKARETSSSFEDGFCGPMDIANGDGTSRDVANPETLLEESKDDGNTSTALTPTKESTTTTAAPPPPQNEFFAFDQSNTSSPTNDIPLSQSSFLTCSSSYHPTMPVGFNYTPLSGSQSQSQTVDDSQDERTLRLETQEPQHHQPLSLFQYPIRRLTTTTPGRSSGDKPRDQPQPQTGATTNTFQPEKYQAGKEDEALSKQTSECFGIANVPPTNSKTICSSDLPESSKTTTCTTERSHCTATADSNVSDERIGGRVVVDKSEPKPFLSTTSASPRKTRESSMATMFQTAGTGASIAVSKESVEKAGALLNSDESSTAPANNTKLFSLGSSSSLLALFQTAGTGASIDVSKESVEKMGELLAVEASSTPSAAGFQTATTGAAIVVSKERTEKAGTLLSNPISSSAPSTTKESSLMFAGFQTAGTGASIAVSKESLEKAGALLSSSTPSNKVEESSPMLTGFQTAGTGTSVSVSKESVEKMGKLLANDKSSTEPSSDLLVSKKTKWSSPRKRSRSKMRLANAMFQTAGTGSFIAVSEEKVAAMARMLKESPASSPIRKEADSGKNASELSPLRKRPKVTGKVSMPMFQTAGSGTSIVVSEEKVEAMGKLLNKASSSMSDESQTGPSVIRTPSEEQKTPMRMFRTTGSGTTIAVSEEGGKEMGRFLNKASSSTFTELRTDQPLVRDLSKVSQTPVAMFQTAGSGASIVVPEEKVKEMGRILNKASLSSPTKLLGPRSSQKYSEVTKLPTAMFHTAGSGTSIAVSEEKIEEMRRMLDEKSSSSTEQPKMIASSHSEKAKPPMAMFRTAGSGASVTVSEEKLEEMRKMLSETSSAIEVTKSRGQSLALGGSHKSSTPVAIFRTAGSGSSIAVSEEKVMEMERMMNKTSSSDKDLFKQQSSQKGLQSSVVATPKAIFETAGSGTSIAVSEEKVKEMGRLLGSLPSSSQDATLNKAALFRRLEEKLPEMEAKPLLPMFQTAGTGTSIAVSEEKVKDMETILNKSASSDRDRLSASIQSDVSSPMETANVLTEAKTPIASSLTTCEDEPAKRNESAPIAMFQTAGTGASISVSEEKIEEMNVLLNKPPTFSEDQISMDIHSTTSVLTKTPMNSSKTPRVVTDAKNHHQYPATSEKRTSGPEPLMSMFQTAGSKTTISVSEEKVDEMGRLLDKNKSPSERDPDSCKPATKSLSSTRTPSSSFVTPRLVTDAKKHTADLVPTKVSLPTSMFQTAGSGEGIQVSEEKIEEMRLMLNRATTPEVEPVRKKAPPQTSEESLLPANNVESTASSKSKSRQRMRMKSNHDFVEANSSSYSESPLRKSGLPESLTPKRNVLETPRHQFVKWGSIRRATYGITPSTGSSSMPASRVRDANLSLQSLAEKHTQDDTTLRLNHEGLHVQSSPKNSEIPVRSANVTVSSGDQGRKRQVVKNGEMTPVPIGKLGEVEDTPTSRGEPISEECTQDTADCHTLKEAIRLGIMSKSASVCRLHGIQEVTMMVNCDNSLHVRFNKEGTPTTLVSEKEDEDSNYLGQISDIRQSLIDGGCDASRIKDTWVRNHSRWIIWKLASYERRFSRFLAGNHLTYENLLRNLMLRFQKEVIDGARSAIRKILNRDVAASKMMTLVVCRIIPLPGKKTEPSSNQQKLIELSDGWYSVKGCLDAKLSEYIDIGLITTGTKLLVSNARLSGAEDGIDPLDQGDGTTCQHFNATLQLSANATRLAKWDAKLGFVNTSNNQHNPKGRLLVKRLSDVLVGGGIIPGIRLFVQRVYPMLYYEKSDFSHPSDSTPASSTKRRVFTEQEEDTRRREFEARKLRVIEKLTERIQTEVEQEVDESAPEVWNQMMKSSTPEEIYESFSTDDKHAISKWKDQRSSLIHRRVREEVEAELETETTLIRESTSFIRVKVHSIYPKSSGTKECATLTIWEPTEDQLSFLKEGSSVEVHSLAVRESNYDGLLQLVANKRTIIEPFAFESSALRKEIGFGQRRFLNLFQVHTLSHERASKRGRTIQNVDFDMAGVQINVVQLPDSPDDFIFHMTDETNLILRIHCRNPPSALKTMLMTEKEGFTSYAMRDLLILPFDLEEQCAVAEFCDTSSVVLTNKRLEKLAKWSASSRNDLSQVAAYVKAGLPLWEQNCNDKVFLGYIMGLRTEGVDNTFIMIDCCGQGTYEWKLPVRVLKEMLSSISPDKYKVILCPDQEDRVSKFGTIGSIFRARGTLWRFQLSELVVQSATEANKRELGRIYGSL